MSATKSYYWKIYFSYIGFIWLISFNSNFIHQESLISSYVFPLQTCEGTFGNCSDQLKFVYKWGIIKPSQMNNFSLIEKRVCNKTNFSFGVSSLHCWIRFLECMLHIAYRLPIKKWKIMEANDKDVVKKNKQRIQDIFRTEKGCTIFIRKFWAFLRKIHLSFLKLGLLVSVVKHGAGTTNDGNTARRFFSDPSFSAPKNCKSKYRIIFKEIKFSFQMRNLSNIFSKDLVPFNRVHLVTLSYI